jgi:hypothetical protein
MLVWNLPRFTYADSFTEYGLTLSLDLSLLILKIMLPLSTEFYDSSECVIYKMTFFKILNYCLYNGDHWRLVNFNCNPVNFRFFPSLPPTSLHRYFHGQNIHRLSLPACVYVYMCRSKHESRVRTKRFLFLNVILYEISTTSISTTSMPSKHKGITSVLIYNVIFLCIISTFNSNTHRNILLSLIYYSFYFLLICFASRFMWKLDIVELTRVSIMLRIGFLS